MMLSGYEPWRRFEADYLTGRKEAYREEKDRITKELIDQAERLVIPESTPVKAFNISFAGRLKSKNGNASGIEKRQMDIMRPLKNVQFLPRSRKARISTTGI